MTTPPNWHCKFCGEPIGGRGTYCSERCARAGENAELHRFRDFLGVVARANEAGGRDVGELYDAVYGLDGSGEDARDFTRRTS